MTEFMIVIVALLLCGLVEDSAWKPHADRIRTALRMADISIEKAAVWMGSDGKPMDTSLLRRQLEGEGHLSYTRLARLPREFWQWFAVLTAKDEGVPPVIRMAAQLHVTLNPTKKRMAEMVDTSDQERWA